MNVLVRLWWSPTEGARMHKARIAALIAGAGALAAAAVAAAAPAVPAASVSRAAPPHIAPWLKVKPGAIRLSMTFQQGPPTTRDCETNLGVECFTPNQIRAEYHTPALYAKGITGKGTTILIVDSFGSPNILGDLKAFDRSFGYPDPPVFKIITPAGKIPPFNKNNPGQDRLAWASETTLDVEYAHAIAPGANIVLAETPVSETEGVQGFPQIVKAETWAINHLPAQHLAVDVISQSFGATEQTFGNGLATLNKFKLRSAFQLARARGVTVLAASGDTGATDVKLDGVTLYDHRVTSWPDSDPLVTSVGGTRLNLNLKTGKFTPAVAWNDTFNSTLFGTDPVPTASGGGNSVLFSRPSYQDSVKARVGARRGVPDISMSAACSAVVDVYATFDQTQSGWNILCGTSEATPLFAGIVALADQVHGKPLGLINPKLYALSAAKAPGIVDVISGNNTVQLGQGGPFVTGFSALRGYDLVTGVGTVYAPALVHELAGR
jgi:subtilase family serine protease